MRLPAIYHIRTPPKRALRTLGDIRKLRARRDHGVAEQELILEALRYNLACLDKRRYPEPPEHSSRRGPTRNISTLDARPGIHDIHKFTPAVLPLASKTPARTCTHATNGPSTSPNPGSTSTRT